MRFWICMSCGLSLLILSGCQESAEISSYEVPKQFLVNAKNQGDEADLDAYEDPDPDGQPDQMRVAVVAEGELAWFFKLVGPKKRVKKLEAPFAGLVESIKFRNLIPVWDLPEGWSEELADQGSIRYATIHIPDPDAAPASDKEGEREGEKTGDNDGKDGKGEDATENEISSEEMMSGEKENGMEITVTQLPWAIDMDEGGMLLANINRWRGQMRLGATIRTLLKRDVEFTEMGGRRVAWVTLNGTFAPPSRGGGGMGPGHPPVGPPMTQAQPDQPTTPVGTTAPEGWTVTQPAMFSVASYLAQNGTVKISVSQVGGGVLANVNRWAGQVGAQQFTEASLKSAFEDVPQGEKTGQFVSVKGGRNSILGVIIPGEAGRNWYFKLSGPNDAAAKERDRFLAFVKDFKIN